eukprot:jgi/Tetstr1/463311/TSEL_008235.t1
MASGGGGHYGLLSLADEVPAVVPHEGLSPLWSYGPATQDNPCSAEPPGGHQCGVPPQVSCPASHKLTDSFLAAKPYLPYPAHSPVSAGAAERHLERRARSQMLRAGELPLPTPVVHLDARMASGVVAESGRPIMHLLTFAVRRYWD